MTASRVRVWSREDLGRRSWRWSCPTCPGRTTVLCHSHSTALYGALRHVAQQHHPSGASSTLRRTGGHS